MKKQLSDKLAAEVENLEEKAEDFWTTQDFEKVIKYNLEAWALLPDEKGDYSESFHIARTISRAYLLLEELERARHWSDIIYNCATFRYDMGERDFLRGKIELESENKKEALKYFKLADKKSHKRCWKGEDNMKYFLFFKQK